MRVLYLLLLGRLCFGATPGISIPAFFFPAPSSDRSTVRYQAQTPQFTNGVHTIGWVGYDNAGRGDGVGSRFMTVLN